MKVTFVYDFKNETFSNYGGVTLFSETGITGVTFDVPLSHYGFLETCKSPVEKFGYIFYNSRINGEPCFTMSRLELNLTSVYFGSYQINNNVDELWQIKQFDIVSYYFNPTNTKHFGNYNSNPNQETFSETITRIIKSRLQRLTVQKQAIILLGIKKRHVASLEWCDRFVIREISKLVLKSGQSGLKEEGVKK